MMENQENYVTETEETPQQKQTRKEKREAALSRKKEILQLINQYNEEILVDGVSTITEETLAKLEDEYAILEDAYPEKLTEEQKESSWIQQVSWWMFIYPIFILFLNLPAMIKLIGLDILYFISYKIPNIANTAPLWLFLAITLFLVPIVLLVITWTIYGFIQKPESKKWFGYVFIFHGVLFLASTLFLFIDFYLPIVNR